MAREEMEAKDPSMATGVPASSALANPLVPRGIRREVASQKHRKDTKSSVIFLRIKRKRTEEPLECLVVQHDAKRPCAPPVSSSSVTIESSSGSATTNTTTNTNTTNNTTTSTSASAASPSISSIAASAPTPLLPSAKRHHRAPQNLVKAFEQLTTASETSRRKRNGFVFTRIDTMEHDELEEVQSAKWAQRLKRKMHTIVKERHASRRRTMQENSMQKRLQQQQLRQKEQRFSESQRARGLSQTKGKSVKCQVCSPGKTASVGSCSCGAKSMGRTEILQQGTIELPGIRLVDLVSQQADKKLEELHPNDTNPVDEPAAAESTPTTLNGQQLKPKRVLNPGERELDEAIWKAFRQNDFGPFFSIFNSFRPDIRGDAARFQRPVDGSTILMAAAANNRPDVIDLLLQPARNPSASGGNGQTTAADVLQEDWEGRTASAFAQMNGHKNVEMALKACEMTQQEKDYVYDVYCVDMSANCQPTGQDRVARVMGTDGIGGGNVGTGAGSTGSSNSSFHGNWLQEAPVVSVSPAVQRWLSQEADRLEEDEEDVDEYLFESDLDSNEEIDGESVDSNDEGYILNDYPDESDHDSSDSDQEMERMRPWGAAEEVWGDEY